MIFSKQRIYAALLALACGFAVTNAESRNSLSEKVIGINADLSLQLEATGKSAFIDIYFPDPEYAMNWLSKHILQQEIEFTSYRLDRYGRRLIASDVEEDMLREGVAVLYAVQKVPSSWRSAESSAHANRHGVWAAESFIIPPENAGRHMQQFRLVEGTVTYIYDAKRATYINFGHDWHQDFSVTIPAKARRGMKEELDQLHPGSRVRVRGAIYDENGPMIRVNRPEQLEIL